MSLSRLKTLLDNISTYKAEAKKAEAEVLAAETAFNNVEAAANLAKQDSDNANTAYQVAASNINGLGSNTTYLLTMAQQKFSLWSDEKKKLDIAENNVKTAAANKAKAEQTLANAEDSLLKAEIAICKKQLSHWDKLSCEKRDLILGLIEVNAREYEDDEDDFDYFKM